MKHYVQMLVNRATGIAEHVATSDAPFDPYPYEGSGTHESQEFEFDNAEDKPKLVRARELLNNIDHNGQGNARIKPQANARRFSGFKRKP